ncbi:peptidase [Liquorilactobacillus sucicola DSM 21376 = JCM 15457]|uniref:Peptidase n=1 Tax=Liquorilactobacillus sucicola DSM 21376 = JCM 15457 TaxID=1423806 RepID=A0A0R2DSG1_9LACO|nr:peptidase [Liquorilactobacillus sucicola DSM 21376 = JCM 15457]
MILYISNFEEETEVRTEITPGVNLTVTPNKQFKTTRIAIALIEPLDSKVLTKRMLLANVLEAASAHFPTQKAVAEKLSKMYGAGFGITVERRGNVHIMNCVFDSVNERYLADEENLFDEAFAFLKQCLFAPLVFNDAFEQETFERQKKNLGFYMQSVKDDKQLYAALSLQKNYFTDEAQRVPSFGTYEQLEKITSKELYDYYLECIAKDQIEIVVSGNVDVKECETLARELPFSKRNSFEGQLFYTQDLQMEVNEENEHQAVVQGKLDLAYNLPIFYREKGYYAALIFNGIFGGLPLSKLFMNVREKSSLAYYANSSYDSFRGFVSVQAGIQPKNKMAVQEIITKQLEDIKNGEILQNEFQDTKKALKNSFLSRLDSPTNNLDQALINILMKRNVSVQEWLQDLDAVSLDDVVEAAQKTKLQSIYFLDGEVN